MLTGILVLAISIGALSAVVGNLSFFRMEATLADHGVHLRLFKSLSDLFQAQREYRRLSVQFGYPRWPSTLLSAALVGVAVSAVLAIVSIAPLWKH